MFTNVNNFYLENLTFGRRTVWIWISCFFFISAVASQESFRPNRFGKREDPLLSKYKTTVFQTGGRFGRSEGKPIKTADSKLFIMPRVDRLYFGSRYGKRADLDEPKVKTLEVDRSIDELVDLVERKLLMDSLLLRKILYPQDCEGRDDC